jgi:hypothetical protein
MRLLLLLGLVLGTVAASAQSRVEVYPDDRMMWRDMLLHAENGVVREGRDWRGQVLWTTQPEKIFAGYSTSAFDLAYSVREGQLIQGDSYFSDAIMYTVEVRGDGLQVFIGDSTFPLDLVYTVRPHPFDEGTFGLYKEDSISAFDRICVFRGMPAPAELYALLLAQGLL